jgi:hypothetical protein
MYTFFLQIYHVIDKRQNFSNQWHTTDSHEKIIIIFPIAGHVKLKNQGSDSK